MESSTVPLLWKHWIVVPTKNTPRALNKLYLIKEHVIAVFGDSDPKHHVKLQVSQTNRSFSICSKQSFRELMQ